MFGARTGLFTGRRSIKHRVMAAVEKKIAEAQKAHDEALKALKAQYLRDYYLLEAEFEGNKDELLETHVNTILGKII